MMGSAQFSVCCHLLVDPQQTDTFHKSDQTFGFEESLFAFASSSKSCDLHNDAILGFWFESFQNDLVLLALCGNI